MSQGKADVEEASTESSGLVRVNVILSAMGIYSRDLRGKNML